MTLLSNLSDLDCQEIVGGRNNNIQIIAGRIEGSNILAANDSDVEVEDSVFIAAGDDVEIEDSPFNNRVSRSFNRVEIEDSFNRSSRRRRS